MITVLGILVAWIGIGMCIWILIMIREMASPQNSDTQPTGEEEKSEGRFYLSLLLNLILWPIFLYVFIRAIATKQTIAGWSQKAQQQLTDRGQKKQQQAPSSVVVLWLPPKLTPDALLRVQEYPDNHMTITHMILLRKGLFHVSRATDKDPRYGFYLGSFQYLSKAQSFCDQDTEWTEACAPGQETKFKELCLKNRSFMEEAE